VLGQHQQNDKKIIEVCITALGGTNLGLTDGRAELSSKLAVGQNSPAEKL